MPKSNPLYSLDNATVVTAILLSIDNVVTNFSKVIPSIVCFEETVSITAFRKRLLKCIISLKLQIGMLLFPGCCQPGDTISAFLSFAAPEVQTGRLYEGLQFQLTEAQRVIANGTVIKILQPNLGMQH